MGGMVKYIIGYFPSVSSTTARKNPYISWIIAFLPTLAMGVPQVHEWKVRVPCLYNLFKDYPVMPGVPSAYSASTFSCNLLWELSLQWGLVFLIKTCPCGLVERHVVTNLVMSP